MSSMRIFSPPKVQASSPFLRKVCPRFLYSKRIAYLPFPLELKPPFFLNFSFIPRSYTIQNVSNGTLLPLRKSSFSTKGPVAAHMKKRRGAVTPTPVNRRRRRCHPQRAAMHRLLSPSSPFAAVSRAPVCAATAAGEGVGVAVVGGVGAEGAPVGGGAGAAGAIVDGGG